MAEETESTESESDSNSGEEAVAKPKMKLQMPNPIVYFFIGPFLLIFVIYIILTKILLTSDLEHEAKLEQVLKMGSEEEIVQEEITSVAEGAQNNPEDAGFLDTHNYFQFPMAFAVNIPETNKNLTFELAVSSFQSGVAAEWFFASFSAFVPAFRSDILYFMGKHSLEDLQSPDFQETLLIDLKDVINAKLESLGAKPEITKVLFLRFVVT